MLRSTLWIFVAALLAAVFGFLGVASAAVWTAKVLFFVFLVLFLGSLLGGLLRREGTSIIHSDTRSKEIS
jgi:uncharacterized membrane protein YtjA (UPF0391 family)